jgi:hypothetical protein
MTKMAREFALDTVEGLAAAIELRRKKGFTQDQFAERAGLRAEFVYIWCTWNCRFWGI